MGAVSKCLRHLSFYPFFPSALAAPLTILLTLLMQGLKFRIGLQCLMKLCQQWISSTDTAVVVATTTDHLMEVGLTLGILSHQQFSVWQQGLVLQLLEVFLEND